MESSLTLASILAQYVARSGYTTGQLARMSGIPKRTLANWIAGHVNKPRHPGDLLKLAIVLRLSDAEADRLLRAGGGPSVAALRNEKQAESNSDLAGLLAAWDAANTFDSDSLIAATGDGNAALRRSHDVALVQGILAAAPQLEATGPFPLVEELFRRAAASARQIGDRRSLAELWRIMGRVARRQSCLQQANTTFEEALAIAREGDFVDLIAGLLGELAISAGLFEVDFARSDACFEEAIAIARRLEDDRLFAWLLKSQGLVAMRRGDYAQAASYFDKGLPLAREVGDSDLITRILTNMGTLASQADQPELALQYWSEALELARNSGNLELIGALLINRAFVHSELDEHDEAERLFRESLHISRHIGQSEMIRGSLGVLIAYYEKVGNPVQAEIHRQELAAHQ